MPDSFLANSEPLFDPDLYRLLPMVEDELCRQPCRNMRLVKHLRYEAAMTGVDASCFALGAGERWDGTLRASTPEFWRHLAGEKDQGLSEVVWLWQKWAIYSHWAKVFSCADPHVLLEKLRG